MFGREPAQYVGYVDGQLGVANSRQVGKFCVFAAAFGDPYGFAYGTGPNPPEQRIGSRRT